MFFVICVLFYLYMRSRSKISKNVITYKLFYLYLTAFDLFDNFDLGNDCLVRIHWYRSFSPQGMVCGLVEFFHTISMIRSFRKKKN